MSPKAGSAVTLLVLAVALFLLGRWGQKTAPLQVPPMRDEGERDKRMRSLKRGGISCQVLAAIFLVASVTVLI